MAGLRTSNLNLLPLLGGSEGDGDVDVKKMSPVTPVNGAFAFNFTANTSLFDAASGSHVGALRLEACGLIYRMWRASFEVFGAQGFKRVHLQVSRFHRWWWSEICPGHCYPFLSLVAKVKLVGSFNL